MGNVLAKVIIMKRFLIEQRLSLCLLLCLSSFAVAVGAETRDVKVLYDKSCKICHSIPVPGAPKTGDAAAWESSLKKGIDVLVNNAKDGFGKMPAKGMCFDCSDDEYKALIELMSQGS